MISWFHEFFFSIFYTGSNEHTSKSCESKLKGADAYRFAECFVCKQTGHLAKACPDNPKGLYPKGKQTHGETKIMSQKEIDLLGLWVLAHQRILAHPNFRWAKT